LFSFCPLDKNLDPLFGDAENRSDLFVGFVLAVQPEDRVTPLAGSPECDFPHAIGSQGFTHGGNMPRMDLSVNFNVGVDQATYLRYRLSHASPTGRE
jgi:hypothetical protein